MSGTCPLPDHNARYNGSCTARCQQPHTCADFADVLAHRVPTATGALSPTECRRRTFALTRSGTCVDLPRFGPGCIDLYSIYRLILELQVLPAIVCWRSTTSPLSTRKDFGVGWTLATHLSNPDSAIFKPFPWIPESSSARSRLPQDLRNGGLLASSSR